MNQTLNLFKEKEKFREGLTNANEINSYLKDQVMIRFNDQDSVILGYPSISNLFRHT